MKHALKMLVVVGMIVIVVGGMLIPIFAVTISESEPNDSSAQANELRATQIMSAAINTTGDTDYFSIPGINTRWGVIALLDTSAVTGTQQGELTMLSSDGSTVLQSDVGSWENGSGIALQSYVSGSDDHYLKVNEQGNNATIANYTLRYYDTIVSTRPEIEPNDTRGTGTLSAYTHEGVLTTTTDVDCFRFAGHTGDDMVFALNGDPEGDGSSADIQLSLIASDDTVLKTANSSGVGGNEFLVYDNLPTDGIYAYCVSVVGGSGGSTATYQVGLVKNGNIYQPTHPIDITQIDPPAGELLLPGDTITLRAVITNTDIITIPGDVDMSLYYNYSNTCLQVVSTNPLSTSASSTYVRWTGLKTDLVPGEAYSITATFKTLQSCTDHVSFNARLPYYDTASGDGVNYTIAYMAYLPLILR